MIETQHEAKQWGMYCHLAGLSGWIGLPLGWILGPLIVWSIKKEEIKFVDDQGREAINFHLNMMVFAFVAALASIFLIGIPFLILISIGSIICPILGTIEASKGNYYRYPCVMFKAV
ncbi:MAG: DUF4870 domain-containing protein [Planctomycetes bacterium]|nr:DUF4870 domain-containing protein [Planctomycetota bacterium]